MCRCWPLRRVLPAGRTPTIMQMGAADLVNIKLMKCGGLYNAPSKIASAAEVYGVGAMIGCMLEAKISVNAAVHLACAKQIITRVDWTAPCCAVGTPSSAVQCSTKRHHCDQRAGPWHAGH